MKIIQRLIIGFLAIWLAACGGSPSLASRDVEVNTNYSGEPVDNILVLSLQEDSLHDSRVIIERGFVQQMRAAGIDATAGYAKFDSMDALLKSPETFQPQLEEMGFSNVLFLDPIRLDTDYDPGEYAARRSAQRALGYDDSAAINLLANMARESSAAKVVMNVGLWNSDYESDLFNATYDINAPGNYDVDAAREYAASFAQNVIEDLRKNGFVN